MFDVPELVWQPEEVCCKQDTWLPPSLALEKTAATLSHFFYQLCELDIARINPVFILKLVNLSLDTLTIIIHLFTYHPNDLPPMTGLS